jgi:hypothetical protein
MSITSEITMCCRRFALEDNFIIYLNIVILIAVVKNEELNEFDFINNVLYINYEHILIINACIKR